MLAMELHLLTIFSFFSAMTIGSIATLPSEVYWNSKLPNTPIPQDIHNLLQSDVVGIGTFWDMGYKNILTPTGDKGEKQKHYESEFAETTDDRREKYKIYESEFVEPTDDRREKYKICESEFVEPTDDRREKYKIYESEFVEPTDDRREKYKIYESEFAESTVDRREKYKIYESEFAEPTDDRREKYKIYESKFDASHVNKPKLPNTTVFFVFDDLHAGKKMTTHLTKSTNKARILARQVAESIPFSTKKFPEILKRFSIDASSPQAKHMKRTLVDCESHGIKGEDRYCGTSLESIVDFILKHVNNDNAQILMNEVDKPRIPQEYTIMDVKYIGANEVVCHKQKYPYAVYYCHSLIGTKVYNTKLAGADGSKTKAVAICHSDTSDWHPKHLAFLLLHMKPGDGTICHFIRSDTFVVIS